MEKKQLEASRNSTQAKVDLGKEEKTLVDLFENACDTYSDKTALACGNETLTYNELGLHSRKLAYFLADKGLKKGDVIALMMPNILAYPISVFAVLQAGLKIVNINPLYTTTEVEKVIADSGARAIIVFSPMQALVSEADSRGQLDLVILVRPGPITTGQTEDAGRGAYWLDTILSMEDRDTTTDENEISAGDVAFLQYTGGTTGVPKAAMLTHANVLSAIKQYRLMAPEFTVSGSEVVLTPLPLYHIFALVFNLLIHLSIGATIVLITDPRQPQGIIDAMRRWPVTIMTGVNTLYAGLLKMGGLTADDFSSLKMCASGATALSHETADKWLSYTGCYISEGYGMTETSGIISFQVAGEKSTQGSVGLPLPDTRVSIRTQDGEELGPGMPGELCIKGPQVMTGYFNNEEETANVMTADGFLRTGDIASVDAQGNISILDRSKDMINVSGFNVYPNEVEQVVAQFSGVLESACMGVPESTSGESVKIVVVTSGDTDVNPDALLHHCRQQLTAYKVPKTVEFVTQLPKTPVGKVLRRRVRELYSA